jgi:ketosteroid isomerase-like protein
VEVDNAMINQRKQRIGMWIAVAAIVLLATGISGCGGSKPTNPRGTPNGTLDELEKAIRREDIDAMLACYTDPFYVIVNSDVTPVTHDIARIAYAIAFAAYDYSTWSLVGRNVTISGSEAFASCTQTMYFGGEWASAPVMYRMCRVGSMWYIYEESTVNLAYTLTPCPR